MSVQTTKAENKKLYKRIAICQVIRWIAIALPYILIIAINHEKYITEKNKISFSIGCVLCLIVFILIVCKQTKYVTGLGTFAVGFLISWFMKSVIDDLMLIFGYGGLGFAVSLVFNGISNKAKETIKENRTAIATYNVFN